MHLFKPTMEKYKELIKSIQNSNLSKNDKSILVNILSEETVDFNKFILILSSIYKLGKVALKLFDLDIDDELIE